MALVAELIVGLMLAAVTIAALRLLPVKVEQVGYVCALIIAALIYLLFGLRSDSWRWWLIETLGLLLFSAVALSSLKFPRWLLALGWLAHIVWDVALHGLSGGVGFVPGWYPATCGAYDLAIGIYLAGRYAKQPLPPAQKLTPR